VLEMSPGPGVCPPTELHPSTLQKIRKMVTLNLEEHLHLESKKERVGTQTAAAAREVTRIISNRIERVGPKKGWPNGAGRHADHRTVQPGAR
jgi:hypothetical protein